jgi:shikimate dehydrogenase
LKPLLTSHHKKALVLGTGGASKAVIYVLKKLGIEFRLVSRIKEMGGSSFTYKELNAEIISGHKLIINASPAGMFPKIYDLPNIPYQFISKDHLLFDLIYNPGETQFMKKGLEKGAKVCNGLNMLYLQAEKAWQIWTGNIINRH